MTAAHQFRGGAGLALVIIVLAFWLYWPVPELGITPEPSTGRVLAITAGSAAEQGGLKVGDRITHIYDYSWDSVNSRMLLVPLPWRDGTPSPVRVERDGATLDLTFHASRPDPALQIEKALRMLVALACWLTGVVLGLSTQGASSGLRWTAWFWVMLGGILALFEFSQLVSYVLSVNIHWALGSILAPAAVMLHMWYPVRPIKTDTLKRAERWWLLTTGLLQVFFLVLLARVQSAGERRDLLDISTMLIFLVCFATSAVILWHAYWETTIAHVRRQIRLIAVACLIVACVWAIVALTAVISPRLAFPSATQTVVAIIVPLAYLYGGISPDLLPIDRLARRLAAHALSVVTILALLAAVVQLGRLDPSPVIAVLIVLAAYQPTFQIVRRLGSWSGVRERRYESLNQATARLGATLDVKELAQILDNGLRATFGDPPLAIYIPCQPGADRLELATVRQLELPQAASQTLLASVWNGLDGLLSVGEVQQRAGRQSLDHDAAALVFAPMVTLWGLIKQTDGAPLGLVVLGPQGDMDPYRERDFEELNRLLAAAGLAFTNSASYAKKEQAQKLIRRLYRHLQEIQDLTDSAFAREIHDEVVNVNVRLNIATLERLCQRVKGSDPKLYDELVMLLKSEQTVIYLLRRICEQLRPAYSELPLGLVTSLRRAVEQARTTWEGKVHFCFEGAMVPVDRQMHREVVRIAREAITNAIKHAAATEIVVALRFPARADEPLILTIRDNGPTRQPIAPKEGHLGMHFMLESADTIGAALTWQPQETGGIEVKVIAPLTGRQEHVLPSELDQWLDKGPLDSEEGQRARAVGSRDTEWDSNKEG